MGLFDRLRNDGSRGAANVWLPPDAARMFEVFGRDGIQRSERTSDETMRLGNLVAAVQQQAWADPQKTTRDVAAFAAPLGGWVTYGATRLLADLVGHSDEPTYQRLLAAGMRFLREREVPLMWLNGNERMWVSANLADETWIAPRTTPPPEIAEIKDYSFGEFRRVATFGFPGGTLREVVIHRGPNYQQFIREVPAEDSHPSDKDLVCEAETAYDLYSQIGRGMGNPTLWADSDLEAFFTYPRPDLS